MREIAGRTALLTGASRGIGAYIARTLADAGMNLALAARSAEGLARVAAEVESRGVRAVPIPTDVGDPAALEALVEKTEAALGGISVLVNNAGIEHTAVYTELPLETITQTIEVNLAAPMLLTRLVLPGMIERGGGHVCHIASVAGLLGTPYSESYSATKHGLVGFARGLRLTAQGEGWPVEVSVVCPGFVSDAGMYDHFRTETGVEAPLLFGTTPAERVASEVRRAIVENVPEVIVNSRPVLPLVLTSRLAPRLGDWLAGVTGALDLFQKVARTRAPGAPR